MKFRRLISILILLVIVVAFFTNPRKEAFMDFIQSGPATFDAPPTVSYTNHFLYSQAEVTYFRPLTEAGKQIAAASKEQYIGVFGKFFKQGD
ncbi:hypothetical protein GCM10027051_02950 [Niabella terrae]